MPQNEDMKFYKLIIAVLFMQTNVFAQIFEKLTDSGNAIVAAPGAPAGSYSGCAWIDYDNDGWSDLFWSGGGLFHNDSGTGFSKITTSGLFTASGIGTSWSDYDNDGFIDCAIANGFGVGSAVYHNNGDGSFTKLSSAPFDMALQLRAWSCAWADIDQDAFTDLILVAPFGFAGITDKNKFLLNKGDGSFSLLDTMAFTQVTAPYTVGTWSDYDMDGDADLFIGSGPANGTVAPDYLYKNQLTETGTAAYFTKMTTGILATDSVDGQVWNWIDYDNDGDADAYLTNYVGTSGGSGMVNNLYRQNSDGSFTKQLPDEAGPIVSDAAASLASVWEDFDNDGDLDCLVTNDAGHCEFYYNNSDGSFTKDDSEYFVTHSGYYYGAAAADYDKDGDLDVFISAVGDGKGLFQNSSSANGNHWVNFNVTGNSADGNNASALGTKIKTRAMINGNNIWQYREISAQNSFGSMNSLNVEFGLGDADKIDSLIIIWPSGDHDTCSNIPADAFYDLKENECYIPAFISPHIIPQFSMQLSPNPAADLLTISVNSVKSDKCTILFSDIQGNIMQKIYDGIVPAGNASWQINLKGVAEGMYSISISNGLNSEVKKFSVIH